MEVSSLECERMKLSLPKNIANFISIERKKIYFEWICERK